MELSGKRLLILGAYNTEVEIVNEAKKLGVHTIVTDNHTDWSLAPAKAVADEAYNISWSDYDALEQLCRERNIDGCIAGFSEIRIKCLSEFCRRMNFFDYTEGADLDTICNKDKFREACIKCGVPVPDSYSPDDPVEKFPVIVKPVDNAGSRGITLCYSREEVLTAYEAAKKSSYCGEAVIEEYMQGDEPQYEPAFFYTIHNGEATLSASLDRIMVDMGDGIIKQAVANVYPSKYLDTFAEKQDAQIKKLFAYMGMKNGIVFMQGKMKNGLYAPVDIGFRLEGSLTFHFTDFVNGMNGMQMMIRYALTGSMGDDELIRQNEQPHFKKPCVTVTLLLTKGRIAEISGLDELRRDDCVIHIAQKLYVGAECTHKADFSQVLCRVYLSSDSKEQLRAAVDRVYDTVKVTDENGNNMLIGRYDGKELE